MKACPCGSTYFTQSDDGKTRCIYCGRAQDKPKGGNDDD